MKNSIVDNTTTIKVPESTVNLPAGLLRNIFSNTTEFFYFSVQAIVHLPFRMLFTYFLRLEVKGKHNLRGVKKPMLIAANHTSYLDGALLYSSLPLSGRIFPIRSIAWRKLLIVPVINVGMILVGTYFVCKGAGVNNPLRKPLEWIKNNGTLLIFPEGQRSTDGSVGKCKRGVSFLALNSNAQLLPVAIAGITRTSFSEFVTRRRKAVVIIGKPFYLRDRMSGDDHRLETGTEIIRNVLQELITSIVSHQ